MIAKAYRMADGHRAVLCRREGRTSRHGKRADEAPRSKRAVRAHAGRGGRSVEADENWPKIVEDAATR